MSLLLLAFLLFLCILIIPLGLPGTWAMLAIAVGYTAMTHDSIHWVNITILGALALIGEIVEFALAGRYARKYGGSKRAGWGAIVGGMVGAFAGFPVPIVGPMIGAFVGAFAGALLFELAGGGRAGAATRVAWGALVGRVVAAAMKVALGLVMAVWILTAAWIS